MGGKHIRGRVALHTAKTDMHRRHEHSVRTPAQGQLDRLPRSRDDAPGSRATQASANPGLRRRTLPASQPPEPTHFPPVVPHLSRIERTTTVKSAGRLPCRCSRLPAGPPVTVPAASVAGCRPAQPVAPARPIATPARMKTSRTENEETRRAMASGPPCLAAQPLRPLLQLGLPFPGQGLRAAQSLQLVGIG